MHNRRTPEAWLEDCPARHRLLAWSALLNMLPSHRQALFVDLPGTVLEQLSRERGYDCLRFPSTSLLERYGVWVEPWLAAGDVQTALVPAGVQPVRLAARAGWREYSPPLQPGLPFSPPRPLRLRQETLGDLLHGLPRVGLVWLNDPAYLADILQGGMAALLARQPVLGMLLPGLPEEPVRQQLRALQGGGYQLFDGGLRPCTLDDLPRECIALPAAHASLAAGCRAWLLQQAEGCAVLDASLVDQWLVNRLAAASPVLQTALGQHLLSPPLADVVGENWHAGEHNGEQRTWRWTGNGPEARLLLPLPAPGRYTLHLRVADEAAAGLASKAQLFLDGWLQVGAGARMTPQALVVLPFFVSPEEWAGAVELRISLPYTARPNPSDPRSLGLSLDLLALKWNVPQWS